MVQSKPESTRRDSDIQRLHGVRKADFRREFFQHIVQGTLSQATGHEMDVHMLFRQVNPQFRRTVIRLLFQLFLVRHVLQCFLCRLDRVFQITIAMSSRDKQRFILATREIDSTFD